MNEKTNIVVIGLGGQGLVLLSRVLATALAIEGKRVLTTDVPPSGQRVCGSYGYIRWGEKIYEPSINEGEADLIVGLEPIETLRTGIRLASRECLVIMNERFVDRQIVSHELYRSLERKLPTTEDIVTYFKRCGINNVKHFDASEVATKETGTLVAMNVVMLGAAYSSGVIPVRQESIENSIAAFAPKRVLEVNLKAFRVGMERFKRL